MVLIGEKTDNVHIMSLSVEGPSFHVPTIGTALTNVTTPIGVEWQLESYVYGIAIVWFLLTLYGFVVGINLRSSAPHKDILCRICVILCLSGIMRAVYLMVEPYETKHRMNPWISRLLFTLATPPLYFTFVFVFYALLKLTKVKMRFYPLRNGKILIVIMCTFMALMASLEMLYQHFSVPILPFYILVLLTFAVWTLALSAAYFRYGFRMLKTLYSLPDISHGGLRPGKLKKLAPFSDKAITLKATPIIRITDENECTYSYKSENASPALSDISDHSDDSNEDSSDEDQPAGNHKEHTLAVNGGGLVVVPENKMSQKKRVRKKKRSRKKHAIRNTSSSRTMKLRTLVRQGFIPSSLCLIQCVWLIFETYNKFYPMSFIGTWEWILVVTIFRLTEIILAASIAIMTRRGFNRL